ncbi:MAG: hypothetical protein OEY95_00480 [Candidatus Bathyarchaeota archaeon]|nr:hypothetical protein [Candidatus Bathyarchaeota archaeon]
MTKMWQEYFKDFLGHPLYLFIFTFVTLLIFALIPQGILQFSCVFALGIFWICIAVAYARINLLWALYGSLPGRIRYHKAIKEIRIINEKGDANIGLIIEGQNLSDSSLDRIFHTVGPYDSTSFPPDKIEGTLDGEKTEVSVESVARTTKNETRPSKYDCKVHFKFPNPIPPKSPLPVHGFSILIPECFRKAFEDPPDRTVHSVDVLTDNLVIRVIVEPSITIADWDFSVEDFHRNVDGEELQRIKKGHPPHLEGEKMLTWTISKPKLTYRYALSFRLVRNLPKL